MYRKSAERKVLCGVDPYLAPKKNTQRIRKSSFFVWFCAASEVSELREKQSQHSEQSPITGKLSSLFNADSNEQYGRRDNVRTFGLKEEDDENVYQKVDDVAMKVGHQISITDISICHRVSSRNLKKDEGCPINVKFVRRQTKSGLMANKKSLKDCEEKIFISDDISLLRTRLAKVLILRADIKSVAMLNEKIVIPKTDESKIYLRQSVQVLLMGSRFHTSCLQDEHTFLLGALSSIH